MGRAGARSDLYVRNPSGSGRGTKEAQLRWRPTQWGQGEVGDLETHEEQTISTTG